MIRSICPKCGGVGHWRNPNVPDEEYEKANVENFVPVWHDEREIIHLVTGDCLYCRGQGEILEEQ